MGAAYNISIIGYTWPMHAQANYTQMLNCGELASCATSWRENSQAVRLSFIPQINYWMKYVLECLINQVQVNSTKTFQSIMSKDRRVTVSNIENIESDQTKNKRIATDYIECIKTKIIQFSIIELYARLVT